MDLKEIKNWCEENGFALVDIKKKYIDPEIIMNLAKESCFISSDLLEKTRKQELTFARNLAINYLHKDITVTKLGEIFNMHHSTIIHAVKLMQDDIIFFKDWQQSAMKHFNKKINEIENNIRV